MLLKPISDRYSLFLILSSVEMSVMSDMQRDMKHFKYHGIPRLIITSFNISVLRKYYMNSKLVCIKLMLNISTLMVPMKLLLTSSQTSDSIFN